MQVIIYERGANGIPTNTILDDLSERIQDVTMTWAALWNCIEASASISGSLADGFAMAENYLGCAVEIRDDDGDLLWNGLVWSVKFGGGGRARVRSLEGYANRVRVVYKPADYSTNPPTLSPTTAVVLPSAATADQALYGIIEEVIDADDMTTATATSLATRTLAERQRLLYAPESGGSGLDSTIELEFVGWYRTIFYRSLTPTTPGTVDVATAVQQIIALAVPFLAGDYSRLQTTGTQTPIQAEGTVNAGEQVKKILGTTNAYTFGVDLDRVPYIRPTNRLSTTPTYLEYADGVLTDVAVGEVDPWDVRPDAVLRQMDFVPTSVNLAAAIDSVESVYLAETTYSMSSGLSYKAAIAGLNGTIEA